MKILILGSGGREHALGWAIRQENPQVELIFSPGNAGTATIGRNVSGSLGDIDGLLALAQSEQADLTLVGPEAPLIAGVVDRFREEKIPIFGPTSQAAAIEGSKVFAKTLLRAHGIPTPAFEVYSDALHARAAVVRGTFPKVIKADGLAAGKGVLIARTPLEAENAVSEILEEHCFGAAGEQVLVESYLSGEEVSVFALARGTEFQILPLAQDHKRIGEGDTGPNTGGMGAYSPYRRGTTGLIQEIEDEIIRPTLAALADAGRPYSGLLYAGLMLVQGKPQVLEFNRRFGDPETQAIVPLLGKGLTHALFAVAAGEGPIPPVESLCGAGQPSNSEAPSMSAATVVLASEGYPGSYRSGYAIEGLDRAGELAETFVFHAGTSSEEGRTVTSGGRVLCVTGRGDSLRDALVRAYDGCACIEFEGMTYRRDIGSRGLQLDWKRGESR